MNFKLSLLCLAVVSGLALCASPGFSAQAQGTLQAYEYERIDTRIAVNVDTTLDVEEHQVFVYEGAFHVGWRSILLEKVDSITDIQVIDGKTGRGLAEVGKRLDKLEPDSWGKFTTFREGGSQNIEWYYDLGDTTQEWILRYKVHGAIAFGKISDRLYWDIFTDYQVPVGEATVEIVLPAALARNTVGQYSYRTFEAGTGVQDYDEDSGILYFSDRNFSEGEDFTVDVSWPHGIVDQSAYWRGFLKFYYGYIGGAIIILFAVLAGVWRWWAAEGSQKGKGTIVPQYEPPENLRPAMAEVIAKEKLTNRGLTATVVDLAIRGFIKIEEDRIENWFGKLGRLFAIQKDYKIINLKNWVESPNLHRYEKDYLRALFEGEDYFSTRSLRRNQSRARRLHESIKEVTEAVYEETQTETKAYEGGPSGEKTKNIIWVLLIVAGFLGFIFFSATHNQFLLLLTALLVSSVGLWSYFKYEARLNERGRILREEWLGFKLYLEVAERYRMQNLTPDLFEKYLPYAMVFGVEKKWAKAFEGMHLSPPNWYAGGVAYSVSGGGGGSFSPSGFSASFSSSFTSAFSSSGGGGGGAGGGGAGGGGGGGGGGAG